MKKHIISWIIQFIVVVILGQTLFFKFADAPETVELFALLGMGAFGYKLIGFLELLACILLLIPNSVLWGAILSWGLMSGALLAHLTKIGFGGANFSLGMLALTAWVLSTAIIYLRKEQVSFVHNMFGGDDDADHA